MTRPRSSTPAVEGTGAGTLPRLAAAVEAIERDARAAVAQLEALPPDGLWADPLAAAQQAIEALVDAAHAVVFPRELQPASAAAIADFDLIFQDSRYTTLLNDAIEVHDAAVATYPDLAALIRSPRLRRQLTKLDLSTEAFDQAIAQQLAAAGQVEPFASALAETVPALRARLETVRQTRQAAAAAIAARAAEDEAEIADVRRQAFERRRRELAARAETLPGSQLVVLAGSLDATTIRSVLQHVQTAETDDRLDELERAIESAEASR